MLLIINLLMTILVTAMIGWFIKTRTFPFNGFKPEGGILGWVNCVFVVYNVCTIVYTWLSIGPLSVIGCLYLALIAGSLYVGYDYSTIADKWRQMRTYGLMSTIRTSYYNLRLKMNDRKNRRR